MTREEILRAMDDVIDGDKPLLAWDALVSVKHRDEFTAYWSCKCLKLQQDYPAVGKLMDTLGLERLKVLRAELAASDHQ